MNILLKLLLHNYPLRDKGGYMPGERWDCQCGIEWLEGEDMTPQEKVEDVKLDFRRNSFLPGLNSKELKK